MKLKLKLRDLISIVFCGILIWCFIVGLFQQKLLESYLELFQTIDASEDIRNIVNKASVLQDRLFLIDKNILQRLNVTHTLSKRLFDKVRKNKPITFALLYPTNSSEQEHILFPILKAWEVGFWVETIINSKPKKFSMYHANLPLGFILRKGDRALIIEIVLLHEREGDFWWHGSFYQDIHYQSKLNNLKVFDKKEYFVLNEEGAFNKFSVQSVNVDDITLNVPDDIPLFLSESTKFIECNYELADKYYRTYGKDTTIRAQKFIHGVRKVLLRTKFILDELQVPFWISSGTLLGFHRQCDVIPYTRDVDIGVFIKYYKDEIKKKFLNSNMVLQFEYGNINDSYELSFVFGNIKLDIFFFYDDGENYWNGAHSTSYVNDELWMEKYKYIFPKFTLCWTEFLDLKVRIPCETETYIKANYGPDWFTPQPDWNYMKSPFNVVKMSIKRKDYLEHFKDAALLRTA
ncbi:UNVERIFIED_CONTAM: hypothetical protein PYX00_000154 [Menopon gallinae]|uniref:Ribitol-5-phosphate transferase FKTN N-terminal domain-containing protein n=1 Tax=Menopon gallinae TaxID=328185 RepID=A0AAW2I875_9NEOP